MWIYEFMLNQSFEVTGQWWLSESPERRISGALKFAETSIELMLHEQLEQDVGEETGIITSKVKMFECIHGQSSNGQKFTLLKVHFASSDGTVNYSARFLVANCHSSAIDRLRFAELAFTCSGLEQFVGQEVFGYGQDGEDEAFKSLSVSYVRPPEPEWRVDAKQLKVVLESRVSHSSDFSFQKLTATNAIRITPNEPRDLDWFIERVWHFCYLLTLLTDEPVSPTSLRVVVEGDDYHTWLIYKSAKKAAAPKEISPLYLFYLAHVVDNFQSILDKWHSATEIMLDAIHLVMDALRNRDQSTAGRFLVATRAVEVISRATTLSQYLTEQEYEPTRVTLTGAIPQEIEADHRDSLKQRIRYGYEHSFRKRIRTLIDSLGNDGQDIVCNVPNSFISGVVDTRNYYTHYTDKLRPKALQPVPLFWVTEKLLFLVRILLLKYVGVSEDLIVRRMKSHPRLMQRIALAKEHPESVA